MSQNSSQALVAMLNDTAGTGIQALIDYVIESKASSSSSSITSSAASPCDGKYLWCVLTLEEIITWSLFFALVVFLIFHIVRCFRAAQDPYNARSAGTFFRWEKYFSWWLVWSTYIYHLHNKTLPLTWPKNEEQEKPWRGL